MFLAAYFVARFLWLPLLACWAAAKGAPSRGAMWLPIGAGMLATAWELAIPASANIRIDIFLVGPMLMFADGLGGLLLAAAARRQRGTAPRQAAALGTAAALCLAACVFFIAAWGYTGKKSEDQYKEHVQGSRHFFEAAFRDDDTQRTIFGSLEGTPWAGYYVSDPPHPGYAHLVVNAEGGYFAYGADFYQRKGRTQPDPGNPAHLTGASFHMGVPTRSIVELRALDGGKLLLRERDANAVEVTFVKRAPPRFPRPASPGDKVRFKGVFSGGQDDTPKHMHLAQLWLWEEDGRPWGVWLRGSYSREKEQPVFANSKADITCADAACTTLHVHTEGGRVEKLTWESPDALAWGERGDRTVTLKRGEIVTGLPFAWAPLTTMEENRKWLRSLHPDIAWKAPAK